MFLLVKHLVQMFDFFFNVYIMSFFHIVSLLLFSIWIHLFEKRSYSANKCYQINKCHNDVATNVVIIKNKCHKVDNKSGV